MKEQGTSGCRVVSLPVASIVGCCQHFHPTPKPPLDLVSHWMQLTEKIFTESVGLTQWFS